MKRRIFLLSTVTAMIAVLSVSSCRKDPLKDMTAEESRIYITNFDDQINFASYSTFSIVDSVVVLSNSKDPKKELTAYDSTFISEVTKNMQARGYTLVSKSAKPDLAINLSRIDNTFTSIYYNPGYWGGGLGYWDTGYWGYPGFGYFWPSYYTVYSRERSAVIDLVDLKNRSNNQLTAIWNAMFRGTGVWNTSNVASMTKAVFDQSPYLKH
jgi:hypothetical protein